MAISALSKLFPLILSLYFQKISADLTPPPLPVLPLPSAPQVTWQSGGMAMFLHFGMNTFTDSEWGTGHADPSLFAPAALDASQWVRVAKDAGFARVVLTAKHHDGFCLWPSAYTNYSVKSSPWRNGTGDVLADVAAAAKEAGLGLGLYLSPWDRHESRYGQTVGYNEYYLAQLRELLTNYGPAQEVWLDGAKGKDAKSMEYYFDTWFSVVRQLQPGAVIFSDAGPDVRWIGDEAGVADASCWSMFNCSDVTIGGDFDYGYSRQGDAYGCNWVPPECDVSIRPGWFWHSSEHPKTPNSLLEIFYNSVGRNCMLLLNVPPNSTGLLADEDVQVLHDFKDLLESIFSVNLAGNAIVTASSVRGNDSQFGPREILMNDMLTYWAPEEGQAKWYLHVDLGSLVSFNVLCVQEAIQLGQRVGEYHLDVLEDGVWCTIVNGTTIGYKKLERFDVVRSQFLRLTIDKARADPLIAFFGLYMDKGTVVNTNDNNRTISGSEYTLNQNNLTTMDGKIRSVSGNVSVKNVLSS
uniref:alpha-L-fucosidase n=1 Tax=Wollemia nobilis TaxID=56998 RepID=A0A0C9S5Q5_9CONI